MKKRTIALIVSMLVSVSAAAGCSSDSGKENKAVKDTVYQSDGSKYYVSGAAVYNISDPDKPVYLSYNDPDNADSNLPAFFRMNKCHMAQNGSEITGPYLDNHKIYKWNIGSDNTVSGSVLYEADSWSEAIKEKLKKYTSYTDDNYKILSGEMMIHGFDSTDAGDGYVYFRYCSQPEYFNQYMPTNYVLCRYDKNGGGLEFIGNDNGVASFDYKDGYIYFADNGFKAVSEYEYTVDKDRVGIYSMKADGTDVKKLVSVKPESDEDKNDQTRILKNVVGRVEVIGDDLYYIAEDKTGETYLYSIPVNGGTPEQVTEKPCADYYADTSSGTLFYQNGTLNISRADGCTVYSKPMDGGEETALYIKLNAPTYGYWASVEGDYLYITNYNMFVGYNTEESDLISGQRFNLKTKEMEKLICTAKPGAKTVSDIDVKWVKDEKEAGADGLKSYL